MQFRKLRKPICIAWYLKNISGVVNVIKNNLSSDTQVIVTQFVLNVLRCCYRRQNFSLRRFVR